MSELYGIVFKISGSFSYYDSSKGFKRESQDTKRISVEPIGENKVFNRQTLMTRILWIMCKYNYTDMCLRCDKGKKCDKKKQCKQCFVLWKLFFQLLNVTYYRKRDYEEDNDWDDKEKKKISIEKIKKFSSVVDKLNSLQDYNHKDIDNIFANNLGEKFIYELFNYLDEHEIFFKVYNEQFKLGREYKFFEGYDGKCKDDYFILRIGVTRYILETNE